MKTKFSRRSVILSGSQLFCATALLNSPGSLWAASLAKTPRMTRGPFYPDKIPLDHDNDLVQVKDQNHESIGQVAHVFGRVLDSTGSPIPNAKIEIWQCDARGVYLHSSDSRHGNRDEAFQGFGRTFSDAEGNYRFRTIKPVPYPGRTPHIHFEVTSAKQKLTTQMFVADEQENLDDWIYNSIAADRQKALTIALEKRNDLEEKAVGGQFDLIL